eukprot:6203272-Pleurochrysis_carterae.AAC.2
MMVWLDADSPGSARPQLSTAGSDLDAYRVQKSKTERTLPTLSHSARHDRRWGESVPTQLGMNADLCHYHKDANVSPHRRASRAVAAKSFGRTSAG